MPPETTPTPLSAQQLAQALEELQQEGKSLARIAAELTTDAGIRRRICEMANSPLRGHKLRIDNPVHAATYIGGRRIAAMIQQRLDDEQAAEEERRVKSEAGKAKLES